MTRRQCGTNEFITVIFTVGTVLILGSIVWAIYQTVTAPVPVIVTCDIPLALRTIHECVMCHTRAFEVRGILQGCAAEGASIVLQSNLIGNATAEGLRLDFPLRASVVMENGHVYLGERSPSPNPGLRYFMMCIVFDGIVGLTVFVCVLGAKSRGSRARGGTQEERLPVAIAQEEICSA